MSVDIRQWPSDSTYYQVCFHDALVGSVFKNANDEFIFHAYAPFDRLDAYGKQLIDKAARDRCVVLNIARRLLK